MLVPALAGLAGYLMSNPRRRTHRRRKTQCRNPENLSPARREGRIRNIAIIKKNAAWHREYAKKWLKEGRKDLAARHEKEADDDDAEALRLEETLRANPKHRRVAKRKVKVRRKVKGKWKTVTTITKTVRRVKTNPQQFWWYQQVRDEKNRPWYRERNDNHAILSATKPRPDTSGRRWRRDKRTERMLGLPDMSVLRPNPGLNLRSPNRLISHGHYFVHDKEAGALVRMYGNGKLPKHGYEQKIVTPEGEFYIGRTPIAYDTRFKTKRGWVWCVY